MSAIRKKLHHPQSYLIGFLSQSFQAESGVPQSVSIPYLIMDRLFDITAGIILAGVVVWSIPGFNPEITIWLVSGLVLLAFFSMIIFLLVHFFRRRSRLDNELSVYERATAPAFMSFVKKSYQIVSRPIGRRKKDIPTAILFTLLAIFTDLATLFMAANATFLSVPSTTLILFYILLLSFCLLPGFPGFPGLADVLSVWFLKILGVPFFQSAVPILILHSFYILGAVLISVIAGMLERIREQQKKIRSSKKEPASGFNILLHVNKKGNSLSLAQVLKCFIESPKGGKKGSKDSQELVIPR
jgi:hypothetical protein